MLADLHFRIHESAGSHYSNSIKPWTISVELAAMPQPIPIMFDMSQSALPNRGAGNHADRSIDILLQKIGATLLLRKLEWQTVTVDHFCRQLSVPPPPLLEHVRLRVPAASYRFVVPRRS
jgi:hypothetical protein